LKNTRAAMISSWLKDPGNISYAVTIEVRSCDKRLAWLVVSIRACAARRACGWERAQIGPASRCDGENEGRCKRAAEGEDHP
jgi:hypothetical protein